MNKDKIKKPELLAPAGNWTMLNAAINSGANAIYFGVKKLNMRSAAGNFDVSDLQKVVEHCHANNIKAHLTLNSIVYENELGDLEEILKAAKEAKIDMIICWDMSVINRCLDYELPICISTQASISNSESVKFYERLGVERVVLARECTLDKIIEIKQKAKIEIETFIHGAMCVAVSGRCFMSHEIFGKSANRGECLQPCRREYEIKDKDEKYTFILGEDYVMSPKDLCTIQFIDKIIEAGIDSLKIEGRKRSPEYIAKVVSSYRAAIDLYFENNLTHEKKNELYDELLKVYNRGFSPGFYLGQPGEEGYTDSYGNEATTKKTYVGKVLNYYSKSGIVFAKLEADKLKIGDSIYIIGNTTGVVELNMDSMMLDDTAVDEAPKGTNVTFKCSQKIREFDQIYKVVTIKK